MKSKIITFIIGLVVGAIITSVGFIIYMNANKGKFDGERPNIERFDKDFNKDGKFNKEDFNKDGKTPPERPSRDKKDSNDENKTENKADSTVENKADEQPNTTESQS